MSHARQLFSLSSTCFGTETCGQAEIERQAPLVEELEARLEAAERMKVERERRIKQLKEEALAYAQVQLHTCAQLIDAVLSIHIGCCLLCTFTPDH